MGQNQNDHHDPQKEDGENLLDRQDQNDREKMRERLLKK